MTPQEKQAQIKAQIYGSYNNTPKPLVKAEENKPIEDEKKEEKTSEDTPDK